MYEIYSIGDGAYLTAVLNAVAMLTGAGDMRELAAIGFLMGVLLVMFQGILQARFPPLQNTLVAWVIYMAMFGPTAQVQIEDLYTGATRTVANVPIGVAFVGSAMSKVGYGVTRLFEQAFSTPAMTDYGFAAPLQILQDVRKGTWSTVAQGAANAPTPGADMAKSWSNYIADCVLWNIDTGRVSADAVLRDPVWTSAFDPHGLVVPTTQLWLGGAPVTSECATAWNSLKAYTTTQYTPDLNKSLAATLRIDPANVTTSIQTALDALAGAGVDAQQYMVMASILPFWAKGKANVFRELGNYSEAAMVEQATQQRNTQWAAEERLFAKIVRPMMTFFEAFLFAISPLMMFAIGLGPVGIKMVGKYLLFALWIQLWKPIMAVINLYIIMAANGKLDALQALAAGNTPVPSMISLWKLDLILADYLGTGGMLAASTPAISLMLIYGSAITATHLAGRLQGGDHINEKMVSPDIMQPSASLTMGPLQTNTALSGTVVPDAHQVLPSINLASSTEQSVRSAQTAQTQSMEAFRSALSNAASQTSSQSSSSGSGGSRTWDVSTGTSETDKFVRERAERISQDFGLSHDSQDAIASAYSGALGLGAQFKGGSSGGTASLDANAIRGSLESNHRMTDSQKEGVADAIAKSVSSDLSSGSDLATRLAQDARTHHENQFTHGLNSQDQSQLERASSDVVSSTRAFERAEATRAQFGVASTYRADHLANGIVSNPGLMSEARQAFTQRFGYLHGDLDRVIDKYKTILGPDKAEAFGMVSLLVGHDKPTIAKMSQEEQQSAAAFGYGLVTKAMGGAPVAETNAYSAQGLIDRAAPYGRAQGAVERAGLRDPRSAARYIPEQAAASYRTAQASVQGAYGEVQERYAINRDNQAVDQARARAGLNDQRRGILTQNIHEKAQLEGSLPRWTVDQLGGLLTKVKNGSASLDAGIWESANNFVQGWQSGTTPAESATNALAAAGDGWNQARNAIIDARAAQVRGTGDMQLNDAQMAVYKAALGTAFPGTDATEKRAAAWAAMDHLYGTKLGRDMSSVIEHAAISEQDDGLSPIRAYNRAETDQDQLRANIEAERNGSPGHGGPRLGSRSGPIAAPANLQARLQNLEATYGLPAGLLTAIAHTESKFNPNAVSGAGAEGMFQIMPDTARRLHVSNPFDPYEAAEGAAKHLAASHKQFGNWDHAVMAYNAGDNRIQNYLKGEGPPLKQETINYLPKVANALSRANMVA